MPNKMNFFAAPFEFLTCCLSFDVILDWCGLRSPSLPSTAKLTLPEHERMVMTYEDWIRPAVRSVKD